MTKAKLLHEKVVSGLRNNIGSNLSHYREGDFSFLEIDGSKWFETDWDINYEAIATIKAPSKSDNYDIENCKIIYTALEDLTPYDARDERFWVYLTHTSLLNYTRKRWTIPDDDNDAINYIQSHFFAKDKRQVERDNSASRLWWMAYLCSRVEEMDIDQALNTFLFKSDVRANIIERPTVSQSIPLFSTLVKKLFESKQGENLLFERSNFRTMMQEINSAGGSKLLDGLNNKQVETLLNYIILNRLNLKKI